jgi:hypothetical protein
MTSAVEIRYPAALQHATNFSIGLIIRANLVYQR